MAQNPKNASSSKGDKDLLPDSKTLLTSFSLHISTNVRKGQKLSEAYANYFGNDEELKFLMGVFGQFCPAWLSSGLGLTLHGPRSVCAFTNPTKLH